MPPRIPTQSLLQAQFASLASSNGSAAAAHIASPLERALLACQSATFPSASRSFSTTTSRGVARNVSVAKQRYLEWMKRQGQELKHHKSGVTNYLGGDAGKNQPFPSNPTFTSYPVLSEDAREMIYRRVVEKEEAVMFVSADLGVDHRRVAAVVRMKAVEKEWERQVCEVPLFCTDCSSSPISMMSTTKIRLVLKTAQYGYKIALRASLRKPPSTFVSYITISYR